jgi:DNA-binding beta-propeller fold protein YncE
MTPVNTATNKPGNPITVPSEAVYIAINPNGKTAYVIGGGRLTPIDTATNKPGNAIKVTNYPVGMVFTPNGKTAYVLTSAGGCGCGPSGPGTVTPVSTATKKPGKLIKVAGLIDMAITPNSKTVYVLTPSTPPTGAQ